MFATNFIITDKSLQVQNADKLTHYERTHGIQTANSITSSFCSVCGSLMYRVSSAWPRARVLRTGTVDDFHLHETKLKPRIEQFVKDRVCWLAAGPDIKQYQDNFFVNAKL